MSMAGLYDIENYMANYTECAQNIRKFARFTYCHRNRIPQDKLNVMDILIENARTCLNQSFIGQCCRHLETLENKVEELINS